MHPRFPFPVGVAAAIAATAASMLAIPSGAHLILGHPNATPLALSSLSLISTAVASIVGVAFLAWRPPSAWATILAALIAAAVMTALPLVLNLESQGWWPLLVVYLTVYGVYVAIALALPAAAAVLHGRDGLRFHAANDQQIDSRLHHAVHR